MALTVESAARKDKRTAQHCAADSLWHRHFAFIAATLADLMPANRMEAGGDGLKPHPDYVKWRAHVDHWCNACAGGNPRFDRARFLRACGIAP